MEIKRRELELQARRIFDVAPEDIPSLIQDMRQKRTLSTTVERLNEAMCSANLRERETAEAALHRLGFI